MSVTSDPRNPRLSAAPSAVARRRDTDQTQRRWVGRTYARLLALWHYGALDRQLAAGIDPRSTAALAARAERITSRRSRTCLANGLERALSSARHPRAGLSAAVRPQAPELITAASVLTVLDRVLRGPGPVSPQGIALLRTLLTDAGSPLYQQSTPGALADLLASAAAALGPSDRPS
jgi:hypothetical protein